MLRPVVALAAKIGSRNRRSFKFVWFGVVVVFLAPLVWKL
jgi:hypothetical protein